MVKCSLVECAAEVELVAFYEDWSEFVEDCKVVREVFEDGQEGMSCLGTQFVQYNNT